MQIASVKGMDLDIKRFTFSDFEFALRLEPENKELNKQYNEAKELYEKVCAHENVESEYCVGNQGIYNFVSELICDIVEYDAAERVVFRVVQIFGLMDIHDALAEQIRIDIYEGI